MYLTGAETQQRMAEHLATIPVHKAVRALPLMQESPRIVASVRQLERGRAMPTDPRMRQIWDGMRGPYQLIMNGEISAEEGARLMQTECERRIADTFL